MLHCKLGLTCLNDSVVRPVFSAFVTSVQMFIAAGWRDGIKKIVVECGIGKVYFGPLENGA